MEASVESLFKSTERSPSPLLSRVVATPSSLTRPLSSVTKSTCPGQLPVGSCWVQTAAVLTQFWFRSTTSISGFLFLRKLLVKNLLTRDCGFFASSSVLTLWSSDIRAVFLPTTANKLCCASTWTINDSRFHSGEDSHKDSYEDSK